MQLTLKRPPEFSGNSSMSPLEVLPKVSQVFLLEVLLKVHPEVLIGVSFLNSLKISIVRYSKISPGSSF